MIRRILASFRKHEEEVVVASRMVVGLGNVGSKYAGTRHNIGFAVVDELAKRYQAAPPRSRFDARIQEVHLDAGRTVLAAPTTMMNNSGHAVAQLANWYKVAPDQILVVHDELDLPFGKMRLRPAGGAGGHNGVRSIIEQLGSNEFNRLRIGIGRPTSGSTVSYVLSRFSVEQREFVPEIVGLAADAADHWVRHGLDSAMNEYNRREVETRQESTAGSSDLRG